MQEELEHKSVAISIKAVKLTGRVLRDAIAAALRKIEEIENTPEIGRNDIKKITGRDGGAIGGTWLLYQKYAGRGYTQTRTYHVGERISAIHTCWTQRGRLFLYETLKSCGILPLIEKQHYGWEVAQ